MLSDFNPIYSTEKAKYDIQKYGNYWTGHEMRNDNELKNIFQRKRTLFSPTVLRTFTAKCGPVRCVTGAG